jgi:hypothetical protein
LRWPGNFKIDQRWEVENFMKHGEIHLNEKKNSRWGTLKICRAWEVVHRNNSSSFGAWEEDHQTCEVQDHFCDVFVFWVNVSVPCLCLKLKNSNNLVNGFLCLILFSVFWLVLWNMPGLGLLHLGTLQIQHMNEVAKLG